jgi:hypothetical protein
MAGAPVDVAVAAVVAAVGIAEESEVMPIKFTLSTSCAREKVHEPRIIAVPQVHSPVDVPPAPALSQGLGGEAIGLLATQQSFYRARIN